MNRSQSVVIGARWALLCWGTRGGPPHTTYCNRLYSVVVDDNEDVVGWIEWLILIGAQKWNWLYVATTGYSLWPASGVWISREPWGWWACSCYWGRWMWSSVDLGQEESCKNTKNTKREPLLGDLNGPYSTLYVDGYTQWQLGRSFVGTLAAQVYVYCGARRRQSLIINVIRLRRWERN